MTRTDIDAPFRRRDILTILADSPPRHACNEQLLATLLRERRYPVTHASLRDDLRWLGERDLVRVVKIDGEALWVPELTRRGDEIVTGQDRIDGVQPPALS